MNEQIQSLQRSLAIIRFLYEAKEHDTKSRFKETLESAESQIRALSNLEKETRDRAESQRNLLRKRNSDLEQQLAVANKEKKACLEKLAIQNAETQMWHERYAIVEDERRDQMRVIEQMEVERNQEPTIFEITECPLCQQPELIMGTDGRYRCAFCDGSFVLDIDRTVLLEKRRSKGCKAMTAPPRLADTLAR